MTTNRFPMGFLVVAILAGSALAPAVQAVTTYHVDNTNGTCVSSRTIRASDSGMTSVKYAVTVYNSTSRIPTSH
jgi:predicted porin